MHPRCNPKDFNMNPDIKIPDLTEAQIKALEEIFPEQSADLNWSDREVWFKAGERAVVRYLKQQYDLQFEKD